MLDYRYKGIGWNNPRFVVRRVQLANGPPARQIQFRVSSLQTLTLLLITYTFQVY